MRRARAPGSARLRLRGICLVVEGCGPKGGWERVKNERKCRDAEAEMKNARKRKAEMLPTAIRMLNSSHNNNNNKSSTTATATRR